MNVLKREQIQTMKGILYFKKETGEMYASLNTYTNVYSYMKDLPKDTQEFFHDLAYDTQEEEDVFIYTVLDALVAELDHYLAQHFERTNRYEWAEGEGDEDE